MGFERFEIQEMLAFELQWSKLIFNKIIEERFLQAGMKHGRFFQLVRLLGSVEGADYN